MISVMGYAVWIANVELVEDLRDHDQKMLLLLCSLSWDHRLNLVILCKTSWLGIDNTLLSPFSLLNPLAKHM